MQYKINVDDGNYTSWKTYIFQDVHINETNIEIDPLKSKLFSNDVFEIHEGEIKIVHSTIRLLPGIPAILVLNDGKTYGHYKNKLLYKCIPDDKRLPAFLVPYQIKASFSKKYDNLYVLLRYQNWEGKHPMGILENVIGNVKELPNYYEYQLYCKSLYSSIQNFTKEAKHKVRMQAIEELIDKAMTSYNIEDRKQEEIFTIDGETTADFDDAIGYVKKDEMIRMSIYISNVSLWIEMLSLWESFSERVSTIYLPDRKRPMLPTILSENLCSLVEKTDKLAFTMDLYIKDDEIERVEYCNTRIRVKKNYHYEEQKLLQNKMYNEIFNLVNVLNNKYNYIKTIDTSSDVVCYLMILMNHYSAKKLIDFNSGIYRSVQFINRNKQNNISDLPDSVSRFLKMWNSAVGSYTLFDNRQSHEMMEVESYTHITSPIRRLVDLLNIIKLQEKLNMVNFGQKAFVFYDKWTERMEYINTTMRAIKKVQTDCDLLELFTNREDIQKNIYNGYIFDKIERADGLFQYMVYLDQLKMVSRITIRNNCENYSKMNFKIYLFEDEHSFKKKIRIGNVD